MALADQFDLGFVRTAHEAGVNGFCLTASGPEVLIKSLELVMLGESVLPFEVLRSLMDAAPQNRNQPLQDNTAEPKLSDLKDMQALGAGGGNPGLLDERERPTRSSPASSTSRKPRSRSTSKPSCARSARPIAPKPPCGRLSACRRQAGASDLNV